MFWGEFHGGGAEQLPGGQLSRGELVKGNCPRGKSPGSNCPGVNFIGGNCPGGAVVQGKMSGYPRIRLEIISMVKNKWRKTVLHMTVLIFALTSIYEIAFYLSHNAQSATIAANDSLYS